jgi:hypothetical protein
MSVTEDTGWSWWVGDSDERFHTECKTRDEAVELARSEGGGYIVEARKPEPPKLSYYFDHYDFIEMAEDRAYEDHGDPDGDAGVFDKVTDEQSKDLEVMVRAAMDAWQEKHGLTFVSYNFQDMRNDEYIRGDNE